MTDGAPGPEAGPDAGPGVATPGRRLAGALVDGAALQVAGLLLGGFAPRTATAISAVAYLAYQVAFVAWRGQTLAKLALGTRVVDAATGGRPILWQAATRAVVPLAGVVVDVALGTAGVGALWVLAVYGALLLDERLRGLHDRAAGTMVVDVERSEAHRRVGVVAVVLAIGVTLVAVGMALEDLEEDGPAGQALAPAGPAAVPTA